MSALGMAIAELHRSERTLARHLRAMAARHHSDQDICHLSQDLAGWSDDHVRELSDHGRRHGARVWPATYRPAAVDAVQSRVSDLLRGRPEPGFLLLVDLRHLHRVAAGASLDWELLAQGAQAVRDADLLDLAMRCHPQTLRQMRCANGMLKELSPQILSG